MSADKPNNAFILIVNNDELVLSSLTLLVSSLGHTCYAAGNGHEAVNTLKENSFDLILSDLDIPEMDGLDLLRHVQKYHPNTDVIISADFDDWERCVLAITNGAVDFLFKPINQVELEVKLARALRERTIAKQLRKLIIHDSLTNLYNRQAFDSHFIREAERASRQNYTIFFALIHIDNFAEYCLKNGSAKGDEQLVVVGKTLLDCTRQSVDLCYYLGEGEFGLLLPQTSGDQATEIVQRILLNYVEYHFDITSLSIGIVLCQRDSQISVEEDEKRMIKRAEQAVKDARKSGENCAICRI